MCWTVNQHINGNYLSFIDPVPINTFNLQYSGTRSMWTPLMLVHTEPNYDTISWVWFLLDSVIPMLVSIISTLYSIQINTLTTTKYCVGQYNESTNTVLTCLCMYFPNGEDCLTWEVTNWIQIDWWWGLNQPPSDHQSSVCPVQQYDLKQGYKALTWDPILNDLTLEQM